MNNKVMPLNNAVINIHNLRLRTYIGFNAEEKEKKQDVIINIEINYAINNAVLEDSVDNALDYKQVTKQGHRACGKWSFSSS